MSPPASRRVRPARPADLARIWEMVNALARYERLERLVTGSSESLGGHLFGPQPLLECLVLESDGALSGYALFFPTYSSFRTRPLMWLEDLYVDPERRGAGAGRALLEAVARRALERGCARLDWILRSARRDPCERRLVSVQPRGGFASRAGRYVTHYLKGRVRSRAASAPGSSISSRSNTSL